MSRDMLVISCEIRHNGALWLRKTDSVTSVKLRAAVRIQIGTLSCVNELDLCHYSRVTEIRSLESRVHHAQSHALPW